MKRTVISLSCSSEKKKIASMKCISHYFFLFFALEKCIGCCVREMRGSLDVRSSIRSELLLNNVVILQCLPNPISSPRQPHNLAAGGLDTCLPGCYISNPIITTSIQAITTATECCHSILFKYLCETDAAVSF